MTYDVCLHSFSALCWALKAQLALYGIDATDRSTRSTPVSLTHLVIQYGTCIKPEITETLSHIKDIDHLSQWIGENPKKDVALSFQAQAVMVSKHIAEHMPQAALVGFLERIDYDNRMANEISRMNEAANVNYASEHVSKGKMMSDWFGGFFKNQ